MGICKTLTTWCRRTKPESTVYNETRWQAEQHPESYVVISKLIGHNRVKVTFTTIEGFPDIVRVRCCSNWKAEDEPRGWYYRKDAVNLYKSLTAQGYNIEVS